MLDQIWKSRHDFRGTLKITLNIEIELDKDIST